MYEWSEEHVMIQGAMRDFIAKEIKPHVEELEHGDMPPYDILRKMYETFGMGAMAEASFRKRIEAEKRGEKLTRKDDDTSGSDPSFTLIPIIERAGGRVTTWDGGPATNGGRIVATGDPRVHEEALSLLA